MKQIRTVKELKEVINILNDEDLICIEINKELKPLQIETIPGIKLNNGKEVNEVRFCQMNNI